MSMSTASVASYKRRKRDIVSFRGHQKGQIMRLKPRRMQRLLSQPEIWIRRRVNSISQRYCLVFIASIGPYEKKIRKVGARVRRTNLCSSRVPTFNIVRNCLGSFEFMEGRWAGYGWALYG